jgi:hypothetical protein
MQMHAIKPKVRKWYKHLLTIEPGSADKNNRLPTNMNGTTHFYIA